MQTISHIGLYTNPSLPSPLSPPTSHAPAPPPPGRHLPPVSYVVAPHAVALPPESWPPPPFPVMHCCPSSCSCTASWSLLPLPVVLLSLAEPQAAPPLSSETTMHVSVQHSNSRSQSFVYVMSTFLFEILIMLGRNIEHAEVKCSIIVYTNWALKMNSLLLFHKMYRSPTPPSKKIGYIKREPLRTTYANMWWSVRFRKFWNISIWKKIGMLKSLRFVHYKK